MSQNILKCRQLLLVGGSQALIKAHPGSENSRTYGTQFCRAIGMSSGAVTDIQERKDANQMIADFNGGVIRAVGTSVGSYAIVTVTCQK